MPGAPLLRFVSRTLLAGGLLVVLAACAGTASSPVSGAGSGSGSGAQGSAGSSVSSGSSGSSGSAAPAGTAHVGSPPTSGTSVVPLPVDPVCSQSPSTITARTGDRPRPLCLRVGQSLTINTQASASQPWQPMTSSNAAILACTSRSAGQGTVTATCKALRLGTATASTTTAPSAGDPHGPPQYAWSLIIEVRPAA